MASTEVYLCLDNDDGGQDSDRTAQNEILAFAGQSDPRRPMAGGREGCRTNFFLSRSRLTLSVA